MAEDFDIREQRNVKDKDFENALRPLRFDDFSGQTKVVENLSVFVEAARFRGEPLDHTLLHGPPGLGLKSPRVLCWTSQVIWQAF